MRIKRFSKLTYDSQYSQYMNQVNGWGFQRIVEGPDHNAYYHKVSFQENGKICSNNNVEEMTYILTKNVKLFVKDFPQLCLQMQRPSEYSKP